MKKDRVSQDRVNRGRGSHDDERDPVTFDLEVVDLEPGRGDEPRDRTRAHPARRDASNTSGMRRRRVPAVIGSIVIVALVGSAIANRSHHTSPSTASPSTSDASHVNLSAQPGAGAPMFPFRVGAQLLAGGDHGLELVDTDTGAVTVPRISNLPLGPITIVAHSGSTVVVRWGADLYWMSITGGSGAAHSIDGDSAFPAARRGSVWVTGPRSATEVPGAANPVATPGPAVGATSAGLLVSTSAGIMVEPTGADGGTGATRVLIPAPATVIGVHPDRVAWVAGGCGVLRCPVHITEVATGATSTWLQLVGDPSPLAVVATTAFFSPDGSELATVIPDDSLTRASSLLITDLRSRATTVLNVNGRFDMPARVGSTDATGLTIDWTLDGTLLVLAPAATTGAGHIAVVDPAAPVVVPSFARVDSGASAAAIGVSSDGALDLPRRGKPGPVAGDVATVPGTTGLSLLGADDHRVDLLDFDHDRITTWPVGGPVPNAAGPNSIARVVGGWLVVRDSGITSLPVLTPSHFVVDLLPDSGGPARVIAPGFQVYSADHGSHAWIVNISDGPLTQVQAFDPKTGHLTAPAIVASGQMIATDAGLAIASHTGVANTAIELVDSAGTVGSPTNFPSATLDLLAGGGTRIVYLEPDGMHLHDFGSGDDVLITAQHAAAAALSPDGTKLVWIDDDTGPLATVGVRAMLINRSVALPGAAIAQLSAAGDRVFVDDNGFVLFTNGSTVFRGRVDQNGSQEIYGLAPDPTALLALS